MQHRSNAFCKKTEVVSSTLSDELFDESNKVFLCARSRVRDVQHLIARAQEAVAIAL